MDVNGVIKSNTGFKLISPTATEVQIQNYNNVNGGWYLGNTVGGNFFLNTLTPAGGYKSQILAQVSSSTNNMYFTGSVLVGATGAPGTTLDVNGNINVGSILYDRANTNYYVNPSANVMPYSAIFAGSVGIGTTGPGAAFDVEQPCCSINTFAKFGNGGANIFIGKAPTSNGAATIDLQTDGITRTHIGSWSGDVTYFNSAGGNVGINTATPGTNLDVNGNAESSIYYDRDNTNYYIDLAGNVMPYSLYAGGSGYLGGSLNLFGESLTTDSRYLGGFMEKGWQFWSGVISINRSGYIHDIVIFSTRISI